MKHVPTITERAASCSCRSWSGAFRLPEETQGKFTLRAHEEHSQHVQNAFGHEAIQLGIFDTQTSLFGDGPSIR